MDIKDINHWITIATIALLIVWVVWGYADSYLTFRKHAKLVKLSQAGLKTLTVLIAVLVIYSYGYFLVTSLWR